MDLGLKGKNALVCGASSGLGLAIARRTIELHGGTIVLDCPTTGGTVMTVVLPRVTATEGSLTAATQ